MSSEEIQALVIDKLQREGSISSTNLIRGGNGKKLDTNILFGVLKSLAGYEKIAFDVIEEEVWTLTTEGSQVASDGSHEVRVLEAVCESMPLGLAVQRLQSLLGNDVSKVGQSVAFKNKWIGLKEGNLVSLIDSLDFPVDNARIVLSKIKLDDTEDIPPEKLKELRRRKLAEPIKRVSYSVRKGPLFSKDTQKPALELTSAMLASGSWRDRPFKQYNFEADGLRPHIGHLHPLLKVREEFRKIFFEMGFIEMPTNRYVENSFWNFDALFVPQQHPARESQDTFFVASPSATANLPKEYVQKVAEMHKNGDDASIGYRAPWHYEETVKNVLRTHTTAVSARMLYALAQQEFKPVRYFSIDKVFRNETVDATHLAEFHQIEGLIADYNLTLGDLIGVLNTFFSKLGMDRLRFKPTYNPYTEPSMEIFSYHDGLGKWIEVGNSGVFRPEMLKPMGFDSSVSVIAWGLSLERPTMIKYHIDNIRDLVGHRVDLNMVYDNPICRLEKLSI